MYLYSVVNVLLPNLLELYHHFTRAVRYALFCQDQMIVCWKACIVSQPRLSRGKREFGQIPIRLLYCILSSSASNEVGVNINWDMFCIGRSSVIMPRSVNYWPKKATARPHSSLNQLTRQEILGMLDEMMIGIWPDSLRAHESLGCETKACIIYM